MNWPKIPNLIQFLREDSPYSTMRVAFVFIIIMFIPAFTYTWVQISFQIKALAVIPESVQWLLGVIFGAKTAQKGLEVLPKVIDAFKKTSTPEGQDGTTDTTKNTETPN